MYFYNGAGVGVGDFNSDNLIDIYFTSNQGSNKLYLNRSNFKFEDVTEEAQVSSQNSWATGVSVADVNADGRLDIYVSNLGRYSIYNDRNKLFINQGNNSDGVPIFVDRASDFGLDLIGFSTQAVFFDYDRDGDLDMFMLNHSLHQNGTFGNASLRKTSHALAGDKLLRNDNGHFVDVTESSRIYSSVIGYGLGVVASDINMDGWLDLYIGNDFHENDYLYLNQRNGTFKEVAEESMSHTSRYTMGVDFADFNNDAFPDLIAMDMLPRDPVVLKSAQAEEPYDVYDFKLKFGYGHQFARNVLQLNNHNGTFSDIALMAGVSATDWSWSAMFADFNLDGHKDIYISNGIVRRSNDLDYINFITADSIQAQLRKPMSRRELAYTEEMPQIKIPNSLFINNTDSTFSDVAMEWGLEHPSFSNGAAYADFDNDGDLDLVVNNINDEAFLYENKTLDKAKKRSDKHYTQFSLKDKGMNSFAIGAKVFLYQTGGLQLQECMPVRGYLSSVDTKLTFGLGSNTHIDSVVVVWSDGVSERLNSVNIDTCNYVTRFDDEVSFDYSKLHFRDKLFAIDKLDIEYEHQENKFVEFNREQLIPHMFSKEGPAVAVGDVTGDGLDDIFLGGAKWQSSKLYVQNGKGKLVFSPQLAFTVDSTYEDIDALLFDVDNDKDLDLFVVSGGNEFYGTSDYLTPRLYINDDGKFIRSSGLPQINLVGSCVAENDIDLDGDVDLFIGARTTTWRYGIKPNSYILINDGKGNFANSTSVMAPELESFGFVKDAIWVDVSGDKRKELVVAGEWMPLTFFSNDNGVLRNISRDILGLENTSGWWNTLTACDIDNDGDFDLAAGNLGLNSKLKTSALQPVRMYVFDFDNNEQIDQVLTQVIDGREFPFHTRDEMTKQMPFLKKRYLSYKEYSKATVQNIFGNSLDGAERYSVQEFKSAIFRNMGNSKFRFEPLPRSAQISQINSIFSFDYTDDGFVDLLTAGNFYPINIQMGRNDASFGQFLLNKNGGAFEAMPSFVSGLSIKGEVRKICSIKIDGNISWLAVKNDDSIEIIQLTKTGKK